MPKPKKETKRPEAPELLRGWKAIGTYLGIGAASAQRWAKSGMPVKREGRYTVAQRDEISQWLGREANMSAPAQIVTGDADISAALKQSIAAVRRDKRKLK